MENQEQRFTLESALQIVIGNLGNVSFPSSVLAIMSPDQIMAVKQMVIDPVELARRNLIEILNAYEMSKQAAMEEQANAEKDNVVEMKPGKKAKSGKKEVQEDESTANAE